MEVPEISQRIKAAVCPEQFPNELNIGTWYPGDDRCGRAFEFYPSDNCSAFAHINKYQDIAGVTVHTHGI